MRDGLSIDKGAVRAAGRHDDRKLQSLIADALGVASGKVPQGRAITNISRPSLRRPYEVLVSPLKLPAQEPFSQSAAAVMILVDPGTIAATDAEQLAHLYDFTPAEGRLAVTLLRELTVAEAADELHISVNTARTHLKRAFEKPARVVKANSFSASPLAWLSFDSAEASPGLTHMGDDHPRV